MGTITRINIHNYRSIKETIDIVFPPNSPLILIGENNTGKSNILRALDLVLGEFWPTNYELEDHEFFNRDKENTPVEIIICVSGVTHTTNSGITRDVNSIYWTHKGTQNEKHLFMLIEGQPPSSYISTQTREQCLCILLSADRRLAYQLSYSSKYTFLSKLMRQFHDSLTSEPDRVLKLKEYFSSVKNVFDGVEQFKVFTEELNKMVLDLSDSLSYGLKTDFSAYDPSNYFHSLKVLPYQENIPLNFEELGTGQEQILALSFVHAYAKAFHGTAGNVILLIEEPEAHLHPLAQKWLARKIMDMSETGVQVVVTTHSPSFINLMKLGGIALIYKSEGATKVKQLNEKMLVDYCVSHGAPISKVNEDNILTFYSAAATEEILSGFFAKKVVLVEGETESFSLPIYFSRLGLNTTKTGIAIIPVHGKGNLCKWWRLFSAYGIPTYIIFDNDTGNDEDSTRRLDILRSLNIDSSLYEEIISEDTIKIGKDYAIFGVDYETSLREIFGEEYTSLEEEAYRLGFNSQSKPLIARYVAEKISYSDEDDRWHKIKELKDKIESLVVFP